MSANHYHFYEPSKGHGLPHQPLLSLVGPRPIGWISTIGGDGVLNLAPFSFFNIICGKPPILAVGVSALKDSARNVEQTGEFVWNLATRDLAEQMNLSSVTLPISADEFEYSGLTPEPAKVVKVPRVKESPVSMECRVTEVIRPRAIGGHLTETRLVLGQVVGVHIRKDLLHDGIYDTAAARPILRGGGPGDYFEILAEGRFFMPRPETV